MPVFVVTISAIWEMRVLVIGLCFLTLGMAGVVMWTPAG